MTCPELRRIRAPSASARPLMTKLVCEMGRRALLCREVNLSLPRQVHGAPERDPSCLTLSGPRAGLAERNITPLAGIPGHCLSHRHPVYRTVAEVRDFRDVRDLPKFTYCEAILAPTGEPDKIRLAFGWPPAH